MFAFALWDARRERLLLARDRMGEKPLYLYQTDGGLIFASEMKALLQSGLVAFELDNVNVDLYFHYQYVPEPRTAVKGVHKLQAAHLLTVDLDPWTVQETSYWCMQDAPALDGDPAQLVRAQLDAVSRLVIRSDVPVGVALSGGLDSSAIAALAVRHYPGKMHAFSVGYADVPGSDERADARALADHLGMPFHDVELTTRDMVAAFPEMTYWRDDPIADIAGYGYYAVMRLAREHDVPVVLQGQAGDELFWGYAWLRRAATETLLKQLLLEWGLPALPRYLFQRGPERRRKDRGLLYAWAKAALETRAGWQTFRRHWASDSAKMVFYDLVPDFRTAQREMDTIYAPAHADAVRERAHPCALFSCPQPWPDVIVHLTQLVSETYLLSNGIVQGDRLSMTASIEQRLPLVDHHLVETVIGLRKARPDHQLPPKARLKAAVADLLPAWVLDRPKRGFTPPVNEWHTALFKAYGPDLVGGYLVEAGILRAEAARDLATGRFPQGAVAPLSFKALVLEEWCRRMHSVYRTKLRTGTGT
jgi:asparagine synthase (glutamine-hydrolysing)